MLKNFTARNFRILQDISVSLAPLTILVGPNGVGKTTTLEFLHSMVSLSLIQQMGNQDPWNTKIVEGTIGDGENNFKVKGWATDRNQPLLMWELEKSEIAINSPMFPKQNSQLWPATFPEVVIRLHLETNMLRQESNPDTPIGRIGPNGQGLAAVINDLKTTDDSRFDYIMAAMKNIVPRLKGMKAPRVPQSGKFTLSFSTDAANDIPARNMSDGTLYALALITTLSSDSNRETLVLLDDIDQGLHPKAQAELIAQIRKIQQRSPNLQIVATCHSPYLADSLSGDEVVLMYGDENGYAHAKRLSDHPDYTRLHGALSTGEFWGSVGEAWVTEKKEANS